jgi:predicted alpha/beta-fold hydrolase
METLIAAIPTPLLFVAWVLISLVVIAFFFTTLIGATRVFRPKIINGRPHFPVEEISFNNRDGLTLRGWWHANDLSKPVILMCHGTGTSRADLKDLYHRLEKMGFGLLLFDFRGLGESDGYKCSFGHKERWDVVAAVDFLKTTGRLANRSLCLYGLSMGAASICLAAEQIREIVQPSAVVLDSAFARFAPITKMIANDWPLLMRLLFLPLILFVGNRVFQVPSFIINPERRIHFLSPARLLIIHSKADELIPYEHA